MKEYVNNMDEKFEIQMTNHQSLFWSKREIGVNFFMQEKCENGGGGSEGGQLEDQIFSGFFVTLFFSAANIEILVRDKTNSIALLCISLRCIALCLRSTFQEK